MQKILKNERGSVALFVLLSALFFLVVVTGVAVSFKNKESQIDSQFEKIKLSYEKDANQVYDEAVNNRFPYIAELRTEEGKTVQPVSNIDNIIALDDFDNKVIIPKGFGIPYDSGTKVEDGVVIEDADSNRSTYGSQFVWVPVGNHIKVTDRVSQTKAMDIELKKYVFNADGTINDELSKLGPKEPITVNNNNYIEVLKNETSNNQHAKDIEAFINSVNRNKGYYIARYEAGVKGTTASSLSLTYTINNEEFNKNCSDKNYLVIKKGIGVWNNLTQQNASILSREMYNIDSDKVNSDLMNDYSWNTTIVYIQKCGNKGEDSLKYSIQRGGRVNVPYPYYLASTGNNTLKMKIGVYEERTEEIPDEYCNIYSMSGSVEEYGTTTCTKEGKPITFYGGDFFYNYYTSARREYEISDGGSAIGFRPILYF